MPTNKVQLYTDALKDELNYYKITDDIKYLYFNAVFSSFPFSKDSSSNVKTSLDKFFTNFDEFLYYFLLKKSDYFTYFTTTVDNITDNFKKPYEPTSIPARYVIERLVVFLLYLNIVPDLKGEIINRLYSTHLAKDLLDTDFPLRASVALTDSQTVLKIVEATSANNDSIKRELRICTSVKKVGETKTMLTPGKDILLLCSNLTMHFDIELWVNGTKEGIITRRCTLNNLTTSQIIDGCEQLKK